MRGIVHTERIDQLKQKAMWEETESGITERELVSESLQQNADRVD